MVLTPSVERYLEARQAASTRRVYESCLRQLGLWATDRGLAHSLPLPTEALAQFLAERADAGRSIQTLRRYAAAVGDAHRAQGLADPAATPLIRNVLSGIARTRRTASPRKAALTPSDIERMFHAQPASLLGLRDRAILLLGFAAALRRSELAALQVADLAFSADGLELSIRRSKADQTAQGQRIFVPRGKTLCPVAAVEAWLAASGLVSGRLFRRISHADRLRETPLQGQAIAGIVHRAARLAGLDPERFAGHSLRAGFATAAAAKGASTWAILAVTRHRSPEALRPYVRSDQARDIAEPARVL
jgi:integrase